MNLETYFLSSLDNTRFTQTRECTFEKRLRFNTGKDCALVKLVPPVVGQDFGLPADIDLFVIAARHQGQELFPITTFPCSVHIARPLIEDIGVREVITKEDLEVIAWGDLYKTRFDADHADSHSYASGSRAPVEFTVRPPRFLGEQDGVPERQLKEKLVRMFDLVPWVTTAYLARVRYGDSKLASVALCVVGQPGQNRVFAEQIAGIFASIFGSHEHMDIIWITPEQDQELASLCRPFFSSR